MSPKYASLSALARVAAHQLAAAVRDGRPDLILELPLPTETVVVEGVPYVIVAGETADIESALLEGGVAAIAIVLEPLDAHTESLNPEEGGVRASNGALLTRRERQVAELLARRHTNAEIAEWLSISEHTARNHVRHILRKLGVRSRRDVAAALQADAELRPARNASAVNGR